jgi:hypothetical protein
VVPDGTYALLPFYFTARCEGFYWLAILLTFALGTAAGDLVAEHFGLGYLSTGVLFGMIIILVGYMNPCRLHEFHGPGKGVGFARVAGGTMENAKRLQRLDLRSPVHGL